jgi:hypothetical protein
MESDYKPVILSETIDDARERYTAFVDNSGVDKDQVYLLDLEAEEPAQKARNTQMMGSLNDPDSKSQIKAIFTDKNGMREISTWDQCMIMPWFELKTKTEKD